MNFYDHRWAQTTIQSARSEEAGKPIANNTRLFRRGDSFAVKLHNTNVVTIHPDGTYSLAAGGYHTVTTMQRIRAFSPAHLMSDRGDWYLRLQPSKKDPRPAVVNRSIPKPFTASDPGDEPVKSELGCQAGTMLGTEHVNELVEVWRTDMLESDELVDVTYESAHNSDYDKVAVRRTWTSWIFYGEEPYSYQNKQFTHPSANRDNTTYEQCPHCKAFDAKHEAWRMQMYGARWGTRFDGQTGYVKYAEMIERFGTQEAWQEAYLEDFRARREYLTADKEWDHRNRVPFYDGIVIDQDGYALRLRDSGPSPAKLRRHEAKVKRIKQQIDKYVNNYIDALKQGMPMPGGGDCWYCLMREVDTGTTWGDLSGADHLFEHMKDRYYVPSLAVNALRERGYKDVGIAMWLDMDFDAQRMGKENGSYDGVKRDITKYLRKRMVPSAPTE